MLLTSFSPKNLFRNRSNHAEWIEESVEFFRQLGFFEANSRMTTLSLSAKLEQLQEETYGRKYRPYIQTSDFDLIAWDQKRVWFADADALVIPDNEVYVQALQELSFISRKQFSVSAIKEVWEGEEGPITVFFSHKRKKYDFSPKYLDTYFDYNILVYLNTFLDQTRFSFELCGDILENPIVLLLHEEEKQLLSIKRGWKFADLKKN